MRAFGLQTHIWDNNFKSTLLLLGFPVLLLILFYGVWVLMIAVSGQTAYLQDGLVLALERTLDSWPFALMGAAVWFAIAWVFHQHMIAAATGARGLSRREAPDLYNLLENLSIAAGVTMPKLAVIDSPQLNAFASGIDDKSYTVTVTRGLMEHLNRDELEAVLAHELTHITNKDVRLLIVAVIFVGIFSFVGEIAFRGLFHAGMRSPRAPRGRRSGERGQGYLLLIALVIIAVAYLLAIATRFALSRKREYLADAGAAELTKKPEAMVSALQKISGRSRVDAPGEIEQMFIENDVKFAGLLATHPPIEKRIEALQIFAMGGAANL